MTDNEMDNGSVQDELRVHLESRGSTPDDLLDILNPQEVMKWTTVQGKRSHPM